MYKLYYEKSGEGEAILFLHGLGASRRSWSEVLKNFPSKYKLILVDLLGFGRSPKPNIEYNLGEHLSAIEGVLEKEKVKSLTVIGHSAGGLLSIDLVKRNKNIKRLILINPTLFKSAELAKEMIIKAYPRARYLLFTKLGFIYCGTHNLFDSFFKLILPLFFPEYPKEIIEDFLDHTWNSYRKSYKSIIEQQNSINLLKEVKIPTLIIFGKGDGYMNKKLLLSLEGENKFIKLKELAGGHDLPITFPEDVGRVVLGFLGRR